MKRVVNLKILVGLGLLSIIAVLPASLRAAQPASPAGKAPAASPAPAAKVPVTPATTANVPATKASAAPATTANTPAAKAAPTAPASTTSTPAPSVNSSVPPTAPLLMRLAPQKDIFSRREGLVMQFIFTARAKTKLCLDKDILSQMQVSIFKSGQGKLPLKPLVIKDNSHLFLDPMRVVWLDSGQSLTVRANLKRFDLDGGSTWTPGEYSADATFNLCEQTPVVPVTDPGQETPIKAQRPGWFMIME